MVEPKLSRQIVAPGASQPTPGPNAKRNAAKFERGFAPRLDPGRPEHTERPRTARRKAERYERKGPARHARDIAIKVAALNLREAARKAALK